MAATSKASDLTLGNFLKIVSKGAVYNNLSEDSPIWDLIQKKKKGPAEGRELRFLVRSAYGSNAVGFVAVDGGAYPTATQSTISEGTAQYKDFALTVEVERTLVAKAISDFSKYGEPLAEEMRAKTIALSRQLSRAAYADGTGSLCKISAAAVSGTDILITVDESIGVSGHVGWFEPGDRVNVYEKDGLTQQEPTTAGTFDHFRVKSRDRANSQVTLEPWTATAVDTASAVNTIGAGDYIYRDHQITNGTIPDQDSISTTDYQTLSEDFVGLEALSEDDSIVVNGITQEGALGGTRRNAGGNPIDSQDFQKLMSQVMIAVGQGRYKYNKAMMAWETLDALIESREVDRRFQSIQDNKRGTSSLGYVHGRNTLMFDADEFCPMKRVYVCPEGDVLQFHGSDFELVSANPGDKFYLKSNGDAVGGYKRSLQAFMEGSGVLVSTHNAALGCIENFTV